MTYSGQDFIDELAGIPLNRTCLECMVNPVKEAGEVCSYECYGAWIEWHIDRDDEMIVLDEDEVLMLPLELQGFHKHTWRKR